MGAKNSEFIAAIIPGAKASHAAYGVPASVTMAQAILESGWGKSLLATCAHNLFGIKADSSWKGESVLLPTTEYFKGVKTIINAPFRKYETVADSIADHALFLKNNKRYAPAFKCTSGCDFAKAIAKAGYATDPNYAELLGALIRQHDFDQYDQIG
ncbi:MAG: glycoside hydrolase family 73 protein [Methylobacter sp.]